jgi:hypothetical protein
MHALSRRLAGCIIAGVSCLVTLSPIAAAGAPPASTLRITNAAHPHALGTPHLDYYGGHVLHHVKVSIVVWGSWTYDSSVPLTGTHSISSFYAGITASKHIDWLSEYDTPTQHIKRGTLDGVYTVQPPAAADGPRISDTQIASALRTMIDTGQLPKPSTNRLYVIFFRSGQTITTVDGDSARNFCAFHDTTAYKRSTAYFAVMPYEVGSRGCQPTSTSFDNVTTIASHELVEAITDPGVGLNRIAWYDRAGGEIADICAGVSTPAAVVGGDGVRYVVQREWSNQANACIVRR